MTQNIKTTRTQGSDVILLVIFTVSSRIFLSETNFFSHCKWMAVMKTLTIYILVPLTWFLLRHQQFYHCSHCFGYHQCKWQQRKRKIELNIIVKIVLSSQTFWKRPQSPLEFCAPHFENCCSPNVAPQVLAHNLKNSVLGQAVISAPQPKASYPVTLT